MKLLKYGRFINQIALSTFYFPSRERIKCNELSFVAKFERNEAAAVVRADNFAKGRTNVSSTRIARISFLPRLAKGRKF